MSTGRARHGKPIDALEPYDDNEIDLALAEFRRRAEEGEQITNAELAAFGRRVGPRGRSAATIRRWIRRGRPRPRQRYAVDRDFKIQLVLSGGNVTAALRAEARAGSRLPVGVRTVQRAVADLPEGERVAYAAGEDAARALDLTILQYVAERNRIWHLDVFHSRRPVLNANGRGYVDAHVIVVVDAASGALAAITAVRGEVDHQDCLHAVGDAMRRTPKISPVHGRPTLVVHDNGTYFTSHRFWAPLRRPLLKVRCEAIRPYEKRLNGKVERAIGTLRSLLAGPLDDGSLEDFDGKPLVGEDRSAVDLRTLIAELNAAAREYNDLPYRHDRRISKWHAYENRCPGVVNPVAPELLSPFLRRADVPVRPKGVTLDNETYIHHALRRHVGKPDAEVRYRDMDDDHVEVWWAGKRVCVAENVRDLSEGGRGAITLTRHTDRDRRAAVLREAARRSESYAADSRDAVAGRDVADDRPAWRAEDPYGERSDDV